MRYAASKKLQRAKKAEAIAAGKTEEEGEVAGAHVHPLMQLTTFDPKGINPYDKKEETKEHEAWEPPDDFIENVASAYEPHRELNWKHEAATRRNWGNVAHILEIVARNGGHKELYAVIHAAPGASKKLAPFEKKAGEIFGRTKSVLSSARADLKGYNWQMAHVARSAASRLQKYLQSGPKSSRSFRQKEGRSGKSDHVSHYAYHYPPMSEAEFMRISRIPGVKGLLRKQHE